MIQPRTLSNQTLLFAAGALAGIMTFLFGIVLITRLVAFEPDLPPLDVAISAEATVTIRTFIPEQAGTGRNDRKLGGRYMLHYAFLDGDDTLQSVDAEVSAIYFNAHPEGSTVTAYYFPGRPQVSVLDSPAGLAVTGSRWGQLFGGLLLLVGGIAAVTLGNRVAIARRGHGWL